MKITEKAQALRSDVTAKTTAAIAAAFGLVIALSWNEFIKEAVTNIVDALGLTGQAVWLKLAAAVITTLICVVGIKVFSK